MTRINKLIYILFFIVLCLLIIFGYHSGKRLHTKATTLYSVTDYQGTKVDFPAKPQRILTLSMSTDEIVLGMVKPDKVIAVNNMLDDPVSSNIPDIGKQIATKIKNPTAEDIYSMNPDLVIVPNWNNAKIIDGLRELGLKVIVVPGAKNIDEVELSVQMIADAIDEHEKGVRLVSMMNNKIADIQAKVAKIPQNKRKKIVLLSLMPGYGGIGSSFDDLCKYAGVTNGMAEIGLRNWQPLTKENLVKIDPDILFLPTYTDHGNLDTADHNRQYLDDPSLQEMKAIKNNALIYPREGYIYSASQNIVLGIQEIDRCVYGADFDFPDKTNLSVVGE